MATIDIRLFGKLSVSRSGRESSDSVCGKLQELFGFMLMHRGALHTREKLATLLWSDYSTSQARHCLRQALWQLKSMLGNQRSSDCDLLVINSDQVGINPKADIWMDISAFEHAFSTVKNVPPEQLQSDEIEILCRAADLYQGDLLTGCHEDWCLCERERFRDMYLAMLQKLMGYYEVQGMFDRGLEYGETLLRFDHAHEQTHRIMMRLRYLSGDRTGAMHQYSRCREALERELDVKPSARTETLYRQILNDEAGLISSISSLPLTEIEPSTASLPEILSLLQRLVNILPELEERVRRELETIEQRFKLPIERKLSTSDGGNIKTRMRRPLRRLRAGHQS